MVLLQAFNIIFFPNNCKCYSTKSILIFHQSSDPIIPLCRTKFASWGKNLNLNIFKKRTKIISKTNGYFPCPEGQAGDMTCNDSSYNKVERVSPPKECEPNTLVTDVKKTMSLFLLSCYRSDCCISHLYIPCSS